jgi:hypothetical protein
MSKTKTNWQRVAKQAIANGYQPGNAWETILRKSLERNRPELVKQLGNNLEHYLQAKTSRAQEMYETMVSEQGMPGEVARELAMNELLEVSGGD